MGKKKNFREKTSNNLVAYVWGRATHFEQMQLAAGGACTDQEVFREEETLALTLFAQRQCAQAHFAQFASFHWRQLDQRAWKRRPARWGEGGKWIKSNLIKIGRHFPDEGDSRDSIQLVSLEDTMRLASEKIITRHIHLEVIMAHALTCKGSRTFGEEIAGKRVTHLAVQRSGWCLRGCHSPPQSCAQWRDSYGCFQCHSLHHASFWIWTKILHIEQYTTY